MTKKRKTQLVAARAALVAKRAEVPGASPAFTPGLRPAQALKRQKLQAATVVRSELAETPSLATRPRSAPDRFAAQTWALTQGSQSYLALERAEGTAPADVPDGAHIIDNAMLVALIEELAVCHECEDVQSKLRFCAYASRSRAFIFECVQCGQREEIVTSPLTQVAIGDAGAKGTRRYAKEVMAAHLSGAGYAIYRKLMPMLGLPVVSNYAFHHYTSDVILPAAKRAYNMIQRWSSRPFAGPTIRGCGGAATSCVLLGS